MELAAHSAYSELFYPVAYWRTASQLEVDFILGDHEIAVEVKGTRQAAEHHLRGLRAFREEFTTRHSILVSRDPNPRTTGDGIEILPWRVFLERLWRNELMAS